METLFKQDKTFKITPEISERYNLTKGYQYLFIIKQ